MTKPTQAQIEAAAKAIEKVRRCGRFSSCAELAEAALTAAEVGGIDWTYIDAALAVATSATIERCAQVADKAIPGHWASASIAAAIRALKDKP